MSEAMSDVMSNLRDHAPHVSAAKEAAGAVKSHLPSVDLDAVRTHLPSMPSVDTSVVTDRLPKSGKKRSLLAAALGLAAAIGAFSLLRRRRGTPAPSASMYTPPLPKP